MNIFWLDSDPLEAARMQCDKHVVKMVLETAQILCHVHHHFGNRTDIPYRSLGKGHHNHPSVKWAMESYENYQWLVRHGMQLCTEYFLRYKKIHKCEAVIKWAATHDPVRLPESGLTPIRLAIKKEHYEKAFVAGDPVASYRRYYVLDKHKFAKWNRFGPPAWWEPLCNELLTQ